MNVEKCVVWRMFCLVDAESGKTLPEKGNGEGGFRGDERSAPKAESFELFDEELELVLYLQPITQANNNARPSRV